MPLPEMHGRTHVPAGYASVVQPFSDPADLIEQGTSDQLPSIAGAGGTTAAYLDDFNFAGTGASVSTGTWQDVATGTGANQRYLNEFFKTDDDWGRNFAAGRITRTESALYVFIAYVDLDVIPGTTIGVMISISGGEDYVNTETAVAGNTRVATAIERGGNLSGGAILKCYHNSAGARDLLEARLHVRRYELLSAGTFEDFV